MQCIFVSDLHGRTNHYSTLFQILHKETPDAVFIGGDLLPNHHVLQQDMQTFLTQNFFSPLQKLQKIKKKKTQFFLILGNDDPRMYEPLFIVEEHAGLLHYVHNKTVSFHDKYVTGCSYVPPTPFQLKDWERYDVSRYVDVGAVSPEKGIRTVEIPADDIQYMTIADDLEKLADNSPVERTIFLFHSPPYNSYLDRANLDGKNVDHATVDVHVGSIAIQRFITIKQPFLTLHGHVHESAMITGHWKQHFGKTWSFSAAHDGPELAVVRFDCNALAKATRDLIPMI